MFRAPDLALEGVDALVPDRDLEVHTSDQSLKTTEEVAEGLLDIRAVFATEVFVRTAEEIIHSMVTEALEDTTVEAKVVPLVLNEDTSRAIRGMKPIMKRKPTIRRILKH